MAAARILVVEDNEAFLLYLEAHLKTYGYEVVGHSTDGTEGIALCERLQPDLVLMDIVLEGTLDGIEAAEIIRQRFDIPVLYLSAYSEQELFRRARITSPYAYITKPFNERELHLTLEIALDRHRMERELKQHKVELNRLVDERTAGLARSEARYRHLVEGIADAVYLIDPVAMRFIDVNAAACSSTGYSREELLDLGPHDLKPFFNRQRLTERFGRLLAGDPEARIIETVHKRKDDSVFPVEIVLRACDIDGEQAIVAVARDISERRRVENRLREAEESFRQLAENIDEVFWIRDLEARRFLYVSPAYETLFGKPVSSIYRNPRSFLSAVHPEDRERVSAFIESMEAHRTAAEIEYRLRLPEGELRCVWVRTFPIQNPQGQVYRSAGIAQDITQRRLADERYRTVLQSAMDGFWEIDFQGRILEVNEAYCRMSGRSREELLSLAVPDLEARETPEDTARHIENILATGHDRFESQHRRKDGSLIDLEISVYCHDTGKNGRFYCFLRDITERNRSERSLRENEQRFRVALRNSRVVVFNQDRDLRYTWIYNPALGYRSEEVIGRTDADIFPSREDAEKLTQMKRRVIDTGLALEQEIQIQGENGPLFYNLNIEAMREPDDRIVGVTCSALDITEIKQREARLRLSEEHFRLLFEHAPIGIALVSPDYRLSQVNTAFCNMLGYSAEELQQRTFVDITHADDIALDVEQAKRLFSGEIPSYQMVKRYLRKDGEILWIQLTGTIIRDAHGAPLCGVGMVENITERVEAERERLAHESRQRDALVREVHHRIKNNLQGVIGLLRQHVTETPSLGNAVEDAVAQINTIALVHGLQSRIIDSELHLGKLLTAIGRSATDLTRPSSRLVVADELCGDIRLDSTTAVPIALILNELIQNAFKHGQPSGTVRIHVGGPDDAVTVHITNPAAHWPDGFDFVTGVGLGTGLGLVRTLLPKRGAHLRFEYQAGQLNVWLRLAPPVILIHTSASATQS